MDERRRDRHLIKWASRLQPADAERYWAVVNQLRERFAVRDYGEDTSRLSREFEALQRKGHRPHP